MYKLWGVCYPTVVTCTKCIYAGDTTLTNFVEIKFCGLK